jgi:hypothetical protein
VVLVGVGGWFLVGFGGVNKKKREKKKNGVTREHSHDQVRPTGIYVIVYKDREG